MKVHAGARDIELTEQEVQILFDLVQQWFWGEKTEDEGEVAAARAQRDAWVKVWKERRAEG